MQEAFGPFGKGNGDYGVLANSSKPVVLGTNPQFACRCGFVREVGMPHEPAEIRGVVALVGGNELELPQKAHCYLRDRYHLEHLGDDSGMISWIKTNVPDLVIARLTSAMSDRFSLGQILIDNHIPSSISLLLLTSSRSKKLRMIALQEGADDCLTTPLDLSWFYTRVDNLVARSQRVRLELRLTAPSQTGFAVHDSYGGDRIAFLKKVEESIDANLDNTDFNVRLLARSVATGRANLYRQLRMFGNLSPRRLILERRLQHAASLLNNSRITVSEAAYTVGFKSVSHFSRSFRKYHGLPPTAYLKTPTARND